MTLSNSPILPLGEADSFLSSPMNLQSPSQIMGVYALAEMDVQEAQESILLIPAAIEADRFVLESDILSVLRGEIQLWLKMLRDQGQMVTDLMSSSVRDQSVRHIARKLLDEAFATPAKSWMTMLPTGKQVVIAPREVVGAVGFDLICKLVHERAIRTAQAHGRPYNARALTYYGNAKPGENA